PRTPPGPERPGLRSGGSPRRRSTDPAVAGTGPRQGARSPEDRPGSRRPHAARAGGARVARQPVASVDLAAAVERAVEQECALPLRTRREADGEVDIVLVEGHGPV